LPNLACNSNTNCRACPISRFLFQNLCLGCPLIAHCYQCFSNGTGCARCNPGYFTNGAACLNCAAGCAECISSNFCLAAATGYYLLAFNTIQSGKISQCSPFCKTC
jgi:hypothetical protein